MEKEICKNCGNEIVANYCSVCGQRRGSGRLTWKSLINDFITPFLGDEAYGMKGIHMRMGATMTLISMIVRPSRTIIEYTSGHTRKYFNPVMIILLISSLYAIMFELLGMELKSVDMGNSDVTSKLVTAFVMYTQNHPAAMSLLMIPFQALSLKYIFRKVSSLRFIEYIYICIFYAMIDVVILLLILPITAVTDIEGMGHISSAIGFMYAYISLKHLLNLGYLKGLYLYIKSYIFSIITMFIAAVMVVTMLLIANGEFDEFAESDGAEIKGPREVVIDAPKDEFRSDTPNVAIESPEAEIAE